MRVAVIGGGVAGLSAAFELSRRGHEPIVFESAGRAGGKVGSLRDGPWLTEDGPHFIARPMDALLDAAGVRGEVLEPAPPRTRWVWLEGRPLRAPSLGLLARMGVARALLEPFLARPLGEDRPLGGFLQTRLGPRAGGLLATLLAAGVYAGDAGKLSARTAFPSLSQGSLLLRRRPRSRLWSLREGLGSLPSALAVRLGGRLRLGAAVSRLQPSSPGWLVEGERFDAVVLAVPASAAAKLLPALDVAGLRSAAVTLVHLGLPEGELPRGFGLLDASAELRFLGALLPSSMLPGRAPPGSALVTAICGGARHPEIAALPDDELANGVREDLRRAFGTRAPPLYQRIVRIAEAIPQYEVGHEARVRAARGSLSGLPPIELAGAAWDGVSVPDAARSGAEAAARLIGDG